MPNTAKQLRDQARESLVKSLKSKDVGKIILDLENFIELKIKEEFMKQRISGAIRAKWNNDWKPLRRQDPSHSPSGVAASRRSRA